MSWNKSYLQYKKLVKELLFVYSEKEYMEEVLKEYHNEFEKYYREYCSENNINKQKLDEENSEKINKMLPPPESPEEDEDERTPMEAPPPPKRDAAYKTFSRIYRLIAKKIHPDKFSNLKKTEEIEEKETMFKQASSAFSQQNWASLLEIAERLDIKPHSFDGLNRRLRDEISDIKKEISRIEDIYSWKFSQCEEDNDCKERLIKHFLNQLFNLGLK
tara:strand:+ start:3686 stop:4336 length:651 start_codon:yes stop_codon:yes gene_type:complete